MPVFIAEAIAQLPKFGAAILANWKIILVGSLALALVAQHGCLVKTQKQLAAERTQHQIDNRICKANDAAAKVAVAKANASVQAVVDAGKKSTAAAQKAVQAAQARVTVAFNAASVILAKPTGPDACKAVHSLRQEMSK